MRAWHQNIRRAAAERRTIRGVRFDSLAEGKRWSELLLLEKAGEISLLRRQVRYALEINGKPVKIRSKGFPNGRSCYYTADFSYVEDGLIVVEEYKGHDDATSRLRRAVVEAIYGIKIKVTGPART